MLCVPVGSMLHILLELSQGALLVMSHMHRGSLSCNQKEDMDRKCQSCPITSEDQHKVGGQLLTLAKREKATFTDASKCG